VKRETKAFFLALSAVIAGCSSSASTSIWPATAARTVSAGSSSDALRYAMAMGLIAPDRMELDHEPTPSSSGGGDLLTAGLGAASPPTGMSAGAAAGVSLGLMLIGGNVPQPNDTIQLAAWVPGTEARGPHDAVELAEAAFNSARTRAFTEGLSRERFISSKYPVNHSQSYGGKLPLEGNLVPFTAQSSSSPNFLDSPNSYGPIFIRQPLIYVDARKNGMHPREAMATLSRQLPDWFLLYAPALNDGSRVWPAAMFRSGQEHVIPTIQPK